MSIDIDSPVAKAQTRQEITRCLHETVDRIHNGLRNIPAFVIEALSSRVWEQERVFPGGTRQGPMPFSRFVTEPYPVGLGTSVDVRRTLLTLCSSVDAPHGFAERAIGLLDEALNVPPSR